MIRVSLGRIHTRIFRPPFFPILSSTIQAIMTRLRTGSISISQTTELRREGWKGKETQTEDGVLSCSVLVDEEQERRRKDSSFLCPILRMLRFSVCCTDSMMLTLCGEEALVCHCMYIQDTELIKNAWWKPVWETTVNEQVDTQRILHRKSIRGSDSGSGSWLYFRTH